MATEEKKKSTPCPVCKAPLTLQHDKEEPHMRENPVTFRLQIPMRCTQCGINLEVSVDRSALEADDEE